MFQRSVLLALLVLAATAVPAGAARLDLSNDCDKYMSCNVAVRYEAGPGETNDVRIARFGDTFVITDTGAQVITASSSYCSTAPQRVTCTLPPGFPISPITMFGRDGNDHLDVSALPYNSSILFGDEGDDTLIGGPARDELTGGPGNDTLVGGNSTTVFEYQDLASYSDRLRAIDVDLGKGTMTGARGERDRLVGIEDVRGTRGDDRIVGTDGPNELDGNGGTDRLDGLGGKDSLDGSGTLRGGPGGDTLKLRNRGSATCGDGVDRAVLHGSRLVSDSTCEQIHLDNGVTVQSELDVRDPARARIALKSNIAFQRPQFRSRLTTPSGATVLGRRELRLKQGQDLHPFYLRLNQEGRRYLRRREQAEVLLSTAQNGNRRSAGGTVRLRVRRG